MLHGKLSIFEMCTPAPQPRVLAARPGWAAAGVMSAYDAILGPRDPRAPASNALDLLSGAHGATCYAELSGIVHNGHN